MRINSEIAFQGCKSHRQANKAAWCRWGAAGSACQVGKRQSRRRKEWDVPASDTALETLTINKAQNKTKPNENLPRIHRDEMFIFKGLDAVALDGIGWFVKPAGVSSVSLSENWPLRSDRYSFLTILLIVFFPWWGVDFCQSIRQPWLGQLH